MSRAVFFDIDGVLIDGIHANPQLARRWDTTLEADMGVNPERFTREFIFDVFVKKVSIGQMSVIDALERHLPALGYKGSPMAFHHYWLTRDSVLNQPLLDHVRTLKTSLSRPTRSICALPGYGAIWVCTAISRTSSIRPASACGSPSRASSILSSVASDPRPSHRSFLMIRHMSSRAPALPAGRPCCSTPSTTSPAIPGLPHGCEPCAHNHRRLPMTISTAPLSCPI
jgi:hypothetical protein